MRIFLRFITLLFIAITISVCCVAQTTKLEVTKTVKEFVSNNKNKKSLSMQLLKSASSISYCFSNGAVNPDCQYVGYIIVTPNRVTMKIYHNSYEGYSDSRQLANKEYNNFINSLYALGIKECSDEDIIPPCGAGCSDIEIKKGNKILFKGSENLSITTTKGSLDKPFCSILTESMKEVYEDPSITFSAYGIFGDPTIILEEINKP